MENGDEMLKPGGNLGLGAGGAGDGIEAAGGVAAYLDFREFLLEMIGGDDVQIEKFFNGALPHGVVRHVRLVFRLVPNFPVF